MKLEDIPLTGLMLLAILAGSCRTASVAAPRETSFLTSDGVRVSADIHVGRRGREAPLVLLFHQGGGDARGEYGPIIPRLLDNGLNVIAVDQRSGGDRFGVMNRTVRDLQGRVFSYCDAYPDLEATLDYAESAGFTGPKILWGSSYSASLAIRLAAEHPERVAAVLAFSPSASGPMEACKPDPHVSRLRVPLLALRPSSEMAIPAVATQNAIILEAGHETWEAVDGVHGSSMLVPERSGGNPDLTWQRVLRFIADVRGE